VVVSLPYMDIELFSGSFSAIYGHRAASISDSSTDMYEQGAALINDSFTAIYGRGTTQVIATTERCS